MRGGELPRAGALTGLRDLRRIGPGDGRRGGEPRPGYLRGDLRPGGEAGLRPGEPPLRIGEPLRTGDDGPPLLGGEPRLGGDPMFRRGGVRARRGGDAPLLPNLGGEAGLRGGGVNRRALAGEGDLRLGERRGGEARRAGDMRRGGSGDLLRSAAASSTRLGAPGDEARFGGEGNWGWERGRATGEGARRFGTRTN